MIEPNKKKSPDDEIQSDIDQEDNDANRIQALEPKRDWSLLAISNRTA